ncbi:hypothetical protein PQR02_37635 [Paraburkholderia sediminicola]|uniref:Uncharacterized protein n=1 Tax=Paraburkholderia rhynchosiae TaxID=487049 RepID=A0ACC7NN01_9BURK
MSIVTDLRIKKLDHLPAGSGPAPSEKTRWRTRLRRGQMRHAVDTRRRVPSRNISGDCMSALMEIQMNMRLGEIAGKDVTALKSRIAMLVLRERMLYWKRDERREVASKRRPSIRKKINRAQHTRELFRLKEENNERWAELHAQGYA